MARNRKRKDCKHVATLDNVSYPQCVMHRRVYSPDGASPTVGACEGGGKQPLIIVGGD